MLESVEKLATTLAASLSRETIAGNLEANRLEIEHISDCLRQAGFSVNLIHGSPHHQSAIIAKKSSTGGALGKISIYNHYDVEPIGKKSWRFPPFQFTVENGRVYGRGIADNKGVLWTRLLSILERSQRNTPTPAILWLIQGEEEVGPTISYIPFREAMEAFEADFYLEETGYYGNEGQKFLAYPESASINDFIHGFASKAGTGMYQIEHRHLNKSYAQQPCPFISGIPTGGAYLAFGPNDPHSRIHNNNESMDWAKLLEYEQQFDLFLSMVASLK